ncbi:hypothetical protein K503DRAFT_852339 [Rhizopogon vinicolor AM-OR11-026]|uniref:Uncharacterized protein n=1 Tax=Rhizopogon vinicolor AM-OR11-026 TaxID=1314800 RepID=A0A1B7NJ14_9AGAM|nr:hypothetical protein K503DRAFT_852339 [Rhizopogon vinicolor AM-OR11-026]
MSNVTCNSEYNSILFPWLSNNCEIELILSDIPLISVGILAFGVSAFFIVIRRFTFSVVSLYFSVLLSFAAAIIDLTLIRDLSQPLITTRDILLALSLGLRFLFYWLHVSEPPIGEQRPPSFLRRRSDFLSLNPQVELHSGSWARLGVAGSYAKFALLATIPAITVLQIIWRVFQRYNSYSPVYAADVTLEVIVSVLLLLKLLSNTVATSSIPRTHTFRECGFPIIALIFNIGISIGNLVRFAFTETTVGRLLQGVELYILIVFMTIYHFFCHTQVSAVPNMRNLATKKVELPEQLRVSTFRLSPPAVSTYRISTPSSREIQGRNVNTDGARHSALASVGRATPWVSWRVSRTQSNQDEDKAKLWDQGEAEKGVLDSPNADQGSVGHHRMVSAASVMDEVFTSWREIADDPVPLATATPDKLSVSTRSKGGSLSSAHIWDAVRGNAPRRSLKFPPLSHIEIPATATSSNGSGAAVIMSAPPDPPSQDSLIYESSGVTGRSPTTSRKHSSNTSLDQLKDLQNELDKIIETLRLFSPSSPSSPNSPISTSSSRSDSNYDEQRRQSSSTIRQSSSTGRQSSSTGRQSSSTGARTLSDFSLSNFPSPPWLASEMPSLPTPFPAHNRRLKEDRRARLGSRQGSISDILKLPPPPRIPAALTDMPSSPHSDLTSDPYQEDNGTLPAAAGRPSIFNSGGTQYEITSFIGDLTTPGGYREPMRDVSWDEFGENPLNFTRNIEDSGVSSCLPTTLLRPSPLRAAELTGSSPSFTRNSTQEMLSLVLGSEKQASEPSSDSMELTGQRRMRPLILPSMTISYPPSHSQLLSISPGARSSRRMFGLPPRPGFRVPKAPHEDTLASEAFARPKPPPLIIRSDDEYFAKRAE